MGKASRETCRLKQETKMSSQQRRKSIPDSLLKGPGVEERDIFSGLMDQDGAS